MDNPTLQQFKDQVTDLLMPHAWTIDDRKELLNDAFLTTHGWVRWEISLDQPRPRAFADDCLETLARLPTGHIFIETLLLTLKRRDGEQHKARIDQLITAAPGFCARVRAIAPPPAAPAASSPPDDRTAVLDLLDQRFSRDELQELCFRLDIDYDNLAGETKRAKIRELILLLNRSGRIAHLAAAVVAMKPDTVWPVPVVQPELRPQPALFLSYDDGDAAAAGKVAAALNRDGHVVELGRNLERGSDAWLAATTEALSNAYAVVLIAGHRTDEDRWTRLELLAALDKRKPVVAIQLAGGRLPPYLPVEAPVIDLSLELSSDWSPLRRALPLPLPSAPAPTWLTQAHAPELRERMNELRYMDRLKLEELRHVAQYTRLGGHSQLRRTRGGRLNLPAVVARQEMIHARWRREQEMAVLDETRRFEDAVPELKAIRRAVLLGEPGSGKTTTLFKLAADLADAALFDRVAPVPVLVRLGLWTDAQERFATFLRRLAAELADGLDARLAVGRVALLLDGLNELPVDQHVDKYREIDRFLAEHPDLLAVATCREGDYPADRALALDRVTVAPLDAVRIHEFIHNYLDHDPSYGPPAADDLFRQLAGRDAAETYDRFLQDVGASLDNPFQTFWLADSLPAGLQWGYGSIKGYENRLWIEWLDDRAQPASLLLLAQNPYMLFMLLDVYRNSADHVLPANRGELFDSFVETLLLRERLFRIEPETGAVVRLPAGAAMLESLTDLAYEMQRRRAAAKDSGGALTALPLADATRFLNEAQRKAAASANLLTPGAEVRFTHQLLQEYFVARAMRARIFATAGRAPLLAESVWPADRWWEPANWEEATILLAGLYSDDCTAVVRWLADANPEVAARCLIESGARAPDATKLALRAQWLPRLTDLKRDREARGRAAVGRALGRLSLEDGAPLDNRPGVGVIERDGLRLPDIAWGETVPTGRYTIGGNKDAYEVERRTVTIDQPFQLARYPVTFAQFDCFIHAPDFADARWWAGMPSEEEAYGTRYALRELSEQAFPFANHPRERVSWYQAVAFGRWLSDKLGYTVELPHEYQWEVAARYPDGRFYPWGNTFDPAKTNTNEGGIGRTTAVGVFPQGANPALGLYDLSGNVWEWCRNKYEQPEDDAVDASVARRVLRGGSWLNLRSSARAAYRNNSLPNGRLNDVGCRLVRRPPSHAL